MMIMMMSSAALELDWLVLELLDESYAKSRLEFVSTGKHFFILESFSSYSSYKCRLLNTRTAKHWFCWLPWRNQDSGMGGDFDILGPNF